MLITLICLQSLDGFIARHQQDNLDFGSLQDKEFFRQKTREIGTMIMGRKTFENMPEPAFDSRFSLILTSNPVQFDHKKNSQREFLSASPGAAVKFLQNRGITQAALIGGGIINNAFLQAGLVNEMYITISGHIFGQGVAGFGLDLLNVSLELKSMQTLGKNEILAHYSVHNV